MSANQSNLSAPQYGYDFVVATTLEALNATMFQFLAETTFPVISQYYWIDSNNNTSVVPLQTLLTTPVGRANPSGTTGLDPATVANWDGSGPQPQGISVLDNSSFTNGFIAQIGLPPGFVLPGMPNPNNEAVLPNIVSFNQQSESVIFNLYCSSFQVFEATWERGIVSYNNQSQPAGEAWYLQTTIPINNILNPADLPATVQAKIDTLGGAFSVQRLFFDLDNVSAANAASINFGGIQPGSNTENTLLKVFVEQYCGLLKGLPALGYAIVPNTPPASPDPSTLTLGAMTLEVCPYLEQNTPDESGLGTFNYLCSQSSVIPKAVPFSWNWFDTTEMASQFDGVVAINKNALVAYFQPLLTPFVEKQCYLPGVHVALDGLDTNYQFWLTGGQSCPPLATPNAGCVLSYSYQSPTANDEAGLNGDMGQAWLSSNYQLNVEFTGNNIVITQHLQVYLSADGTFGIGNSYNPIDKIITDTYTISVNQNGGLETVLSSTSQDNSQSPSLNWFTNFLSSDMNDLCTTIQTWLDSFVGSRFSDIPLSTLQDFIFPGSSTFVYSNASFSQYQDLVSYITYTDPQ